MDNQHYKRYQEHDPYGDCEIVTLVIHRDELATLPVADYSKLQK
jgi:hypothetical protein